MVPNRDFFVECLGITNYTPISQYESLQPDGKPSTAKVKPTGSNEPTGFKPQLAHTHIWLVEDRCGRADLELQAGITPPMATGPRCSATVVELWLMTIEDPRGAIELAHGYRLPVTRYSPSLRSSRGFLSDPPEMESPDETNGSSG